MTDPECAAVSLRISQRDGYAVDWGKRRLLPLDRAARACLHGLSLTVWCHDCATDLDVLAADLLP